MKKKSQGGFTLIELLVVIAIIGILASVVLASLNSARNKGADAATKANLANARAQAEIYYDTQTNYTGVCTATTGLLAAVSAVANSSGATAGCTSLPTGWAAAGMLKATAGAWCVDSTGTSRAVTAATTATGAITASACN